MGSLFNHLLQVPFPSFTTLFSVHTLSLTKTCKSLIMLFNPRNVLVNGTITANLFVSSYVGTISTLQLSKSTDGTYALETIAVNNVTTDNPSWLHKDPNNGVLYCLNEGLTVPNGSISSFKIGGDGSLNLLGNVPTINGPVGSVLFNQGKTLAAAH